jgi:TRAP-type C4-dicarboxylate transport system permease large subunit
MGDSFKKEMSKLLSDMLSAFMVLLLSVFVLGMLYAYYFTSRGALAMLWLPVLLLVGLLIYKVLE